MAIFFPGKVDRLPKTCSQEDNCIYLLKTIANNVTLRLKCSNARKPANNRMRLNVKFRTIIISLKSKPLQKQKQKERNPE